MAIKRQTITKPENIIDPDELDVTANVALEIKVSIHPLLRTLAKENSVLAGFLEGGLKLYLYDWSVEGDNGEEELTLNIRANDRF